MNRLRNAMRTFLAVALVAFALPAIAQDKIFSLNMTPASSAGSPATLTATFKNENPTGNSSFNSLVLTAPTGLTITAVAPPPSGTATITGGGQTVQVANMSPVRPGMTFALQLTVSTGGVTSCTSSTGAWSAVPWTGSSFSGSTFALVPPPTSSLTTTITSVCNYSLSMTPISVAKGATPTLIAKFSNLSTSTKSFNSVTLTAPTGFTITTASLPVGRAGTVSTTPTSVTISSITAAVSPGGSLDVTLQMSVACTASTGNWISTVAGGFSLSGSNPSTTVTGACGVQFSPLPPSAVISGVAVTPAVGVKAVNGSGGTIASFTGPVTFTLNPVSGGPGTVAEGTPTNSGGVLSFPNLTITGTGTFTLTAASALGATTSSLFTVYDGDLNCGEPLNPAFTMPTGIVPFTEPGYAAGSRGLSNKDGSLCVRVAYDFTNDILANNTVSIKWDTASQPYAAFAYTLTWKDESVDPGTGMPTGRRTRVGFDIVGGVPTYNFGVACLSPNLPTPYGTLTAPIDNSFDSITISATGPAPLPTVLPFPLVIGTERMTAISGSAGTYTVTRGAGGTTPVAHSFGAVVMSTPLPIDPNATRPNGLPNPFLNKQVPMCIADEGWGAVPGGKVRFTTTVFDIGDGFVLRDF